MQLRTIFFALSALFIFSCTKDDPETDPNVFKNLDNRNIISLAFDNSNTLWIASDTGIFKSVTDGYKLMDVGVQSKLTTLTYESAENKLWIGTLSGLFYVGLNESSLQAEAVSLSNLSNDTIYSAFFDSSSKGWFGTEEGFTLKKADNWQQDSFKKNLSGSISDLDFEVFAVNSIGSWNGNYFFATAGNKLWRTSDWDDEVDAFSGATQWDRPYNGLAIADTMNVVFIDSKGQQWFGGTDGIQVHIGDNPKEQNTTYKNELVNPIVNCVAEDATGSIWVGTENGISVFNGSTWTAKTSNLPCLCINAIAFDEDGSAWIGTKSGLANIE